MKRPDVNPPRVFTSAVGRVGFACLMLFSADLRGGTVVEETFESRAVGERAGWKDYGTVRGASFFGVTGETASPFDGGWHSYRVHRAADQDNGWALLSFPETETAAATWSVDVMVPEGGGGSMALLGASGGVWARLEFAKGFLSIPISKTKFREVAALDPHVWYRMVVSTEPAGNTYGLHVVRQGTSAMSVPVVVAGLPCQAADLRLAHFKIQAASGRHFYFDNLRLVAR